MNKATNNAARTNETKLTLRGPGGIRIELDKSEVIPADPGAGTPAMVYAGRNSASYWCATGEGEIDGTPLTPAQSKWLDAQESKVDSFLYGG